MKKPHEIKKVAVLGCGFIGFSFAIYSEKRKEVNCITEGPKANGKEQSRNKGSL